MDVIKSSIIHCLCFVVGSLEVVMVQILGPSVEVWVSKVGSKCELHRVR